MKLFRISLLVVCVVFLSSCIAEWGDRDCYGGFRLYFEYKPTTATTNTVATFLDHVHYVDVFVFDQDGALAFYRPALNQAAMTRTTRGGTRSSNPGIDLPVGSRAGELSPGGRYRVVVWGNADRQRNSFDNPSQLNAARIGTAPDGGTPLHFGPGSLRANPTQAFWINIPESDYDDSATIEFSRAHVEIQVFVVGASETPTVDLNGVFDGINFNNQTGTGRIPFGRLADTNRNTPEQNPRLAEFVSFYVPLFEENDPVKALEISNSNGTLPGGNINLRDIFAGNPPPNVNQNLGTAPFSLADTNVPEERVQIVIDVVQDPVTGDDKVVNIWVPGWISRPTDPDLW